MALDPEELVTLTDHGTMKTALGGSESDDVATQQRKLATIVREGEPAILNLEQIKSLAAQWDEPFVPID